MTLHLVEILAVGERSLTLLALEELREPVTLRVPLSDASSWAAPVFRLISMVDVVDAQVLVFQNISSPELSFVRFRGSPPLRVVPLVRAGRRGRLPVDPFGQGILDSVPLSIDNVSAVPQGRAVGQSSRFDFRRDAHHTKGGRAFRGSPALRVVPLG